MKLDFNLMRTILAHVEAETIKEFLSDADSLNQWREGQLLTERADEPTKTEVRVVLVHVQMLAQAGYISGIDVSETADGYFVYGLSTYPRLTLDGYALLESLRTKGFVEKLKDFAKSKSVPLRLKR